MVALGWLEKGYGIARIENDGDYYIVQFDEIRR